MSCRWRLGLVWLSLYAVAGAAAGSVETGTALERSVDKGGFRYSEPAVQPSTELDLDAVRQAIAERAAAYCGTISAAQPMAWDPAAQQPKATPGGNAVGKLVGGLLGTPGGRKRPKLARDPIKGRDKAALRHPELKAELQQGARFVDDVLVVSTRIAKAPKKGTLHAQFIETPDCRRFWPVAWEPYGLWGSWQLTVNVTRTERRYENGRLIRERIDRSGWSREGRFALPESVGLLRAVRSGVVDSARRGAASRALLTPADAYLAHLQAQVPAPAWQQLGFGGVQGGARSAGARFALAPGDLPPGSVLVTHLTRPGQDGYQTFGFAARIAAQAGSALTLEPVAATPTASLIPDRPSRRNR